MTEISSGQLYVFLNNPVGLLKHCCELSFRETDAYHCDWNMRKAQTRANHSQKLLTLI